ncbi:MAG: glycosyltransferase family 4 protein, partial [Planctomycetota bacterium]|nr:glycosyltransferase family 4 protein [Planctomycetota bacterium]
FAARRAFNTLDLDWAHCLYRTDALAANRAKHRRNFKTILQITGPPFAFALPRIPPDRWIQREALHGADCRVSISEYVRQVALAEYNVDSTVLPVPVDLSHFTFQPDPPPGPPTILSVADFNDPRKGARALFQSFPIVRTQHPEARLLLSGSISPARRDELLSLIPTAHHPAIEFLGVGKLEDVPSHYRRAHCTALASMHEAFGMVVIESWATGAPVAVTNHAGLAELVTDPTLGARFDPQTTGWETRAAEPLAESILKALELGQSRETRARCRAAAENYSWQTVGPRYESLYQPD